MFCEKCGNTIPENSKFCASCGAKVELAEDADQVVEPTPQPAVAPTPPPAPRPAPQPVPPQYSEVNSNYNKKGNLVKPLSVGSYIGMFILLAIPIVNLIMLLVWSFSDSTNINKKHFAIGYLIVILIGIVLTIAATIVMLRLGYSIFDFYNNII